MQLARITSSRIFPTAVLILCTVCILRAQSSDQYYPTPVTSNEIAGTIKARQVGDARLTTYYFAFNGTQGDIFINVVTRNFSGDIDVYLLDGLKPLTKMVIYADNGTYETGRLIYLRKSEKLMMRIEGRTPGDEAASYRIKFGGSFVALSSKTKDGAQSAPRISTPDDSSVRVNDVGTIIPTPVPSPVKKGTEDAERAATAKSETQANTGNQQNSSSADPKSAPDTTKSKPANKSATTTKPNKNEPKSAGTQPDKSSTNRITKPPAPPRSEKASNPMEGVRLFILLKNGEAHEYKMTEVMRFTVDKGVLVVLGKDGNVVRYSMVDVAKVTLQ